MQTEEMRAQQRQLEQAVAHALTLARRSADGAEVSVSKAIGLSVSTRYGEVENVEFNNDGALAITVWLDQRKGNATSTDLSPQAIEKTVQAALDIARYTSQDPFSAVADRDLLAFDAPDLDLFHPADLTPEQAIDYAARAEQAALQADKRIVNTEGGTLTSHCGIRVFGNSHGMLQSYLSSRHSLSCCVIAQQDGDMERDYAYTLSRYFDRLESPEAVGEQCARRVLARLAPRKIPTRKAPVLFAAEVAGGLFGHLVSAISGSQVYRKSTFLLDKLHQPILPDWLTIDEQPHLPGAIASAPFDAEGVRTTPQQIVQNGVLQQWLLSGYSARKLGLRTNGHSGSIYNWLVTPRGGDLPQLLKTMDTGLLVTELMGQGVNLVTGDYSRGAAGFWVENGEIQFPVSEVTIAGNLRDMLLNIAAVGDDTELRGRIRTGSVLVSEMQIAGQ